MKFVTSNDVRAFCDWLGERDGRKYAIPTEEQWEYACRAGTTTRWSFGDDPAEMRKYGWTAPHASGKHHPVGRLAANPFGLFDMYGNAGELVLAARGEEYQRGGTATESPQRARSAARVPARGDLDPIATRGFRVAVVGDLRSKVPPPAVAPFDAAQPAKEFQNAWAAHLGAPVEVENTVGMKLRVIPPGQFTMGMTKEEAELVKAEDLVAELKRQVPTRGVKLTRPYRLGATEVTVGQFRRFVADTKYKTEAETDGTGGDVIEQGKHAWRASIYCRTSPASPRPTTARSTQVSWNDAVTFCNWLSRREKLPEAYAEQPDGTWRAVPGPGYRLPTEAEWEFACRAGSRTSYFFGDDPKSAGDYAWHKGNAEGRPHPVGEKRPNPFGLFDVLGNVREWVADWDDEQYAPKEPVVDPQGPATGTRRVMRGGGWSSPRGAERPFAHVPPPAAAHLGFRVARSEGAAPPPAKVEPNPVVVAALKDAVAAKTRVRDETKARFEVGKDSKIEFLAAEAELAEARSNSRRRSRSHGAVIELLDQVVKLRQEERDLIALRVGAGVDRPAVLNEADSRLANAKARLAKVKPPAPPEPAPPPRPKP